MRTFMKSEDGFFLIFLLKYDYHQVLRNSQILDFFSHDSLFINNTNFIVSIFCDSVGCFFKIEYLSTL